MKHIVCTFTLIFGVAAAATTAQAGCTAEYKAKRDNPLELFYDVATIDGPCTVANATAQLKAQLAGRGLKLLKVMSVREQ
ncbi:hypothetical protein PEL8287_03093 [Roseovarius litorisediminis]|uniref:Uncharacterized protein n=1 Tax=Roseovarius litorisediminis TaxID=1312363 RepID=A0A1Y5T7U7_9RHOB|nr:hypothetical protein [Roseovarius litorisediminis]SLN57559.1 hypothetical protein PEL8287_03093 [Roseovarius litorisediminis]